MPEELRTEIKIRAAIRNVDMGRWICQAIMQRIEKEDEYGVCIKKD
jgi:hypothetical protein